MTLKSLVLGGVAVAALSGAALVSSPLPARAADADERTTTRDLNSHQLDTPSIVYTQASPERMRPIPAAADEDIVSLDAVSHPRATLTGRIIENQYGEPVGRIERVVLDAGDRPMALEVNLGGYLTNFHRTVTMDAGEAYFDQYNDVIKTDLTRSEIRDLPRTYPD